MTGQLARLKKCEIGPYSFSIAVVEGFQFNNVWMSDDTHNLELSVLVVSSVTPSPYQIYQ